jgi:hypothetical protein
MNATRTSVYGFFQKLFLPTQGGLNPGPAPANSTELPNRLSTQPCRVPVREKIRAIRGSTDYVPYFVFTSTERRGR